MDALRNCSYVVRQDGVYWSNQRIPEAEPASFEALYNCWGTDANHIYVQGTARRGLDRASFQLLNPLFVRDKNGIHDWANAMPEADPNSFEILDSGVIVSSSLNTETWNRGYARDAKQVYYHDQMVGGAEAIPGAHAPSFRSLANDFGLDHQQVYHQKKTLEGANPASWVYLGHGYSVDRKGAWYFAKPLAEISPNRLSVINLPTLGNFATDQTSFLCSGRAVDAEIFWDEVEQDLKDIPEWLQQFKQGELPGQGFLNR